MELECPNSLATKAQGRWTVSPEAHDVVRRLRAAGAAQATVAAAIGVPTSTFRDLLDRDDALAEAFEEGGAALETELVSLLLEQARNGYGPAAMFMLKSMRKFRENDPVQTAAKAPINIVIPPPMDADQLAKLTQSMRDVTPSETGAEGKPEPRKHRGRITR